MLTGLSEITGTLTNTDGIISGFSADNYGYIDLIPEDFSQLKKLGSSWEVLYTGTNALNRVSPEVTLTIYLNMENSSGFKYWRYVVYEDLGRNFAHAANIIMTGKEVTETTQGAEDFTTTEPQLYAFTTDMNKYKG